LSLSVLLFVSVYPAIADSTASYTGSLASSSDVYSLVFNVGGTTGQTVTVQTWSFGGGVNAAGNTIPAGGFDPFVAIFDGTGPTALRRCNHKPVAGARRVHVGSVRRSERRQRRL
ncbi:MAG: DVUA0089 family protein, partial [Candidatus Acidiferrum sp.]